MSASSSAADPASLKTTGLREIQKCEVCGHRQLTPVLDLGIHPMCDDLVPIGDTRICREYPIEILFCETCLTAHQRFQVPKQDLFPATYHYRSRFTVDVLTGMRGLIRSCQHRFGSLKGRCVLDVGCNDGSLLDFFRDAGAITLGIEPTGAAEEAQRKGHQIFRAFLCEDVARAVAGQHGRPDFITFTNVFAHVENLQDLIAALHLLIADDTVLVIENHYLGSVLDGNQFDTFYHEHPRTYSYSSFAVIASALGVRLLDVEFPSRYGGNIRVFMGNIAGQQDTAAGITDLIVRERQYPEKFEALNKNMLRWKNRKGTELKNLARQNGNLRAKAFPGRAAILVKLLGLTEKEIIVVHEKPGSMKIGYYVPGTRIPIHSDDELFALSDKSAPLLNLAWHIPGEIHGYLAENGYHGPVIDVISAEDFSEAG